MVCTGKNSKQLVFSKAVSYYSIKREKMARVLTENERVCDRGGSVTLDFF